MRTLLKPFSLIVQFSLIVFVTAFPVIPADAFARWGAGAYGYGDPGSAGVGSGLTGGYYNGLYGHNGYYDYYNADGFGDTELYDDSGLYEGYGFDQGVTVNEDLGYDYGRVYNPGGLDLDAWDDELYEGYGYEYYYD